MQNIFAESNFYLKDGDLLFQDVNCGRFCDSIDGVTYGYGDTYVSHVAMVVNAKSQILVEANTNGVHYSKLDNFLNTSKDNNGNPRVMVGRLNIKYQNLIPSAIKFTESQIGKPYNVSFIPNNNQSFYCSELISTAFYTANGNKYIFPITPMSFSDLQTKKILPLWSEYYAKLNMLVPEGVLGTNPGALSRSGDVLSIVHYYGNLRVH